MRREFYVDLLARRLAGDVIAEHRIAVGVFMIDDEKPSGRPLFTRIPVRCRKRKESDEIAIESELKRLRLRRVIINIEFRRPAKEGIAPTYYDLRIIALRHSHRVKIGYLKRLEGQRSWSLISISSVTISSISISSGQRRWIKDDHPG